MTNHLTLREAIARIEAWMARGNPSGGMNLPSYDGKTPSIQADLRTLLSALASQSQHIGELSTRIAALEEGLEPFAKAANLDWEIVGTERLRLLRGCISLEDFARARTIFAGKDKP